MCFGKGSPRRKHPCRTHARSPADSHPLGTEHPRVLSAGGSKITLPVTKAEPPGRHTTASDRVSTPLETKVNYMRTSPASPSFSPVPGRTIGSPGTVCCHYGRRDNDRVLHPSSRSREINVRTQVTTPMPHQPPVTSPATEPPALHLPSTLFPQSRESCAPTTPPCEDRGSPPGRRPVSPTR